MLLLTIVTVGIDPLQWLARGVAGFALFMMGTGRALKTWVDGREGVIRGRHDRVEYREADLPHTFAVSVAFHMLVAIAFAAAGLWMLVTAGRWR